MTAAEIAEREAIAEFERTAGADIATEGRDRFRMLFVESVVPQLTAGGLQWRGEYRQFVLRCAAQAGAKAGALTRSRGEVTAGVVDAAFAHLLPLWDAECPDRRPDAPRHGRFPVLAGRDEGPPCAALGNLLGMRLETTATRVDDSSAGVSGRS